MPVRGFTYCRLQIPQQTVRQTACLVFVTTGHGNEPGLARVKRQRINGRLEQMSRMRNCHALDQLTAYLHDFTDAGHGNRNLILSMQTILAGLTAKFGRQIEVFAVSLHRKRQNQASRYGQRH